MHALKGTIFFFVLVLPALIMSSCEDIDYLSLCEEDEVMTTTLSFKHVFFGTIYANEFYGDPNCSSPNMEISGSTVVELSLPFLQCNTSIRTRTVDRKDYYLAINKITVQFHPLIKTVLDCEIIATCDLNYPSLYSVAYYNMLRTLIGALEPKPPESKLDIMSGNQLFGDEIADKVNEKQFLVLNVTNGGKNNQLQIRECYAHAKYIIDQKTTPYLLLDNNLCSEDGITNCIRTIKDKSFSGLIGFSEVQYFDIVDLLSERSFYITCAFDMCLDCCSYSCFEKMEMRHNRWSTVRTHQVGWFDKSFKVFGNRNNDLRTSVKVLSDRLLRLKSLKTAQKSTKNSRLKTLRLDDTEHVANINVSPAFKGETVIRYDEKDTLVQPGEKISTTVSEDMSIVGSNQDVTKTSSGNFIDDVNLNFSVTKALELFGKRSFAEQETEYSDNSSYTVIVDSPKLSTGNNDTSDKSKNLTSGTDCFNSSCRPDEDNGVSDKFKNLRNGSDCFNTSCRQNEDDERFIDSENSVISFVTSKGNSLKFDETTRGTSNLNFTFSNDGILALDNSTDCVPYLKFASVTASLSALCVCLILIILGVVLLTRKELKRYNSHSKYLYNDF